LIQDLKCKTASKNGEWPFQFLRRIWAITIAISLVYTDGHISVLCRSGGFDTAILPLRSFRVSEPISIGQKQFCPVRSMLKLFLMKDRIFGSNLAPDFQSTEQLTVRHHLHQRCDDSLCRDARL
jgi:hypothetical protein